MPIKIINLEFSEPEILGFLWSLCPIPPWMVVVVLYGVCHTSDNIRLGEPVKPSQKLRSRMHEKMIVIHSYVTTFANQFLYTFLQLEEFTSDMSVQMLFLVVQ